MLMTLMFYKLLRGMAIRYEYKTETHSSNILRDSATIDLQLVGKINHEIPNILQWLPPPSQCKYRYKVTSCSVQFYFAKGN